MSTRSTTGREEGEAREKEAVDNNKVPMQQSSGEAKESDVQPTNPSAQKIPSRTDNVARLPEQLDGWTPHRKLNLIVYCILISATAVFLNYEYGGFLSVYLRHYFGREFAVVRGQ